MNRRTLLTTAAAGAAVGLAGVASAAPGSPAELNALFDAFVSEGLDLQPEAATALGLDVGARAYQKSQLTDRSRAATLKGQALTADQYRRLMAFDASALRGMDALNRDIAR